MNEAELMAALLKGSPIAVAILALCFSVWKWIMPMIRELRMQTGTAFDRAFLSMMIEHHKGAITMARTEVDGGQFPAATEMARSIITSQQQEIDSMNAMLAAM